MNKDLQIGQRVRLSEDSEWAHSIDMCNPTDCQGVVSDLDFDGRVLVEWGNGTRNTYRRKASDLIPIEATADSALETLV